MKDSIRNNMIVVRRSKGESAIDIAASYKISARTVRKIVQEAREAKEKVQPKKVKAAKPVETKEILVPTPKEVSKPIYHWVVTSNIISIAVSGGHPVVYAKGHVNFDKARIEIVNGDPEEAIRLLNTTEQVIQKFEFVTIENGKVFYKGKYIDNSLTGRIIDNVTQGKPACALVNFFEKMMKNPDQTVTQGLYDFLQHNDIEIVESGDFIAYKRVNSDYKDFYTRRFDNSVGTTVKMERELVNNNPAQTCSRGLHVAAKHYLPYYYAGKGRIITCQVNPINVVSVPNDYDGAKMRVCEYTVVADVTDEIESQYN